MVNASFAPNVLPARGRAPISFDLTEKIGSEHGGHPAALREAILEFDRNVSIDTRGIPVCGRHKIATAGVAEARRICGDAIVGRGSAQVVFNASGPNRPMTLLIQSSLAVEFSRPTLLARRS